MSYSINQLESKEKQKIRNQIVKTIKTQFKGKHNLKGLTLPNLNFNVEEEILNQFSTATIDCVEQDIKIYNRQLARPIDNRIEFYNDEVFNHIRKTNSIYSWCWIDLCGSLNLNVKNNLINLIQSNKLEDKSIIIITLRRGRENAASRIRESIGSNNLELWRGKLLVEDLKFYGKQVKRKVQLLKEINYKSELQQNSSPMKVLIIKTNK